MGHDLIIIGGGAAGIFSALAAKEASPAASVLVLEKSAVLLAKVRISGGGRCNVTHHCFDPRELVRYYPRGNKELLGPFHRFQPRDTIAWFSSRGVPLKVEADGRMFPESNSSESIIRALLGEAEKLGVEIRLRQRLSSIERNEEGYHVLFADGTALSSKSLVLATGSSPEGHSWARQLGHTIESPVPSLFGFNIPTSPLLEWSGITVENVRVSLKGTSLHQEGPLLLTHFGFSGPAVLKLSAWGARYLHEQNYQVDLLINWVPKLSEEELVAALVQRKEEVPQKTPCGDPLFFLPKNLWRTLLASTEAKRWVDCSRRELIGIAQKLRADLYRVEGKTTHKEEFVTCGGVALREVDFRSMESRCSPRLFFAGEVLDIDGVTGGFNFQNAWTTGFLAGIFSIHHR